MQPRFNANSKYREGYVRATIQKWLLTIQLIYQAMHNPRRWSLRGQKALELATKLRFV